MNYILVIWTVVAMNGGGGSSTKEIKMDWRPIGEFQRIEGCQEGARVLGLTAERFRCLDKKY